MYKLTSEHCEGVAQVYYWPLQALRTNLRKMLMCLFWKLWNLFEEN